MQVLKFVAHSKLAIGIALENKWYPAARYTNLRDIKSAEFTDKGFLDIDWKNYELSRHLDIAARIKPRITVARDVESIFEIDSILREAEELNRYAKLVAIVPKDIRLAKRLEELIPERFILAYSVPTKYGGTSIPTEDFSRPVHLLGGRPEIQRQLADEMNVISFDCNRFTYDAKYGDYFDGVIFRPHPSGGYERCLRESIQNINLLWDDYSLDSTMLNTSIVEAMA